MNKAEKFKKVFGIYAEEFWSKPEKEMLEWIAEEASEEQKEPEVIYCKDCKYSHMTIDGLCKYCDIWFPEEEMYESGKHFCASAEKRSKDDYSGLRW